MPNTPSLYWHDYETFGIDPRRDWPAQFAGVRTDMAFNIIGEPQMFYCKPPSDCLPHPEACVLTRISPLKALHEGLPERDFIARILKTFSQPNTCMLGYNSLRFDDEVTRNALYRNFYDPYEREYQNGNTRWDLIDLVRMTHALRPEGIRWPLNETGHPVFKLELLTQANDIHHQGAHDALVDVYATIELAKLIKNKQPKLFDYLFELRKKEKASALIQQAFHEPVVHVSSKFPASQNCMAMVMAICPEPLNKNATVLCDLSKDLDFLLNAHSDDIRTRLYTKSEALAEDAQRPPIKSVQSNKCPALAPRNTLREQDIERLQLDMKRIEENAALLKKHQRELAEKITEVHKDQTSLPKYRDPDLMIYSGFFSWPDKNKMQKITRMNAEQLSEAQHNLNFEDARVAEMLFRYRARHFPESLDVEEKQQWHNFCVSKFKGEQESSSIHLGDFQKSLAHLQETHAGNDALQGILQDLKQYVAGVASVE